MSGYGRYRRPYRRGDHINIIRTSDDNDADKPEPVGCPLCSIRLHYDLKRNVLWCLHCGFNRPQDLDSPPSSSSSSAAGVKLKTAISDDKDIAASEPDNIPIASKGSRAEEQERRKRHPMQDIMDKDDAKYIKAGHTLVSLTQDMPTKGDMEVLSKDELDRQRQDRIKERTKRRI